MRKLIHGLLLVFILFTVSCSSEETTTLPTPPSGTTTTTTESKPASESGQSGNASTASSSGSSTSVPTGAPAAPTDLTAAAGSGQITVQWKAVTGASSYNLYWSEASGISKAASKKIANASNPYLHAGLINGIAYYYAVTAANDSGESDLSPEVSAIPRTDPGGARMRVVWVQDMGDNRDVFAQGGSLRLMGLDTSDGQGERAILGTPGNYSKPLITPRGDRVVYSDRAQKKVFVVNWDGSGQRAVLGGFALALWRNPADGREWLYYGAMEGNNGDEYCPAVYRVLLDSPGTPELIWNKTPVSVHSFQVSADGRMAGGLFPWPSGGIAQLPNQSWTKLGSGCWTGLSQDNTYTFWIFDEDHRNLYITNATGGQERTINVSLAPGIGGYEVYHPRWGSHPRIMAMTGPYKVGTKSNRITGGGAEVEVYIGRFDANYRTVEAWQQITRNGRADFFPDVWISQ